MSNANELLDSLTDEDISDYTTTPVEEGHIVISPDRIITVPSALKRIAVEHDHNIETVTFDCPRYWDGIDMSGMTIYVNYKLSNNYYDAYPVDNVTVDDTDESLMHFDWTITRNVTQVDGQLEFSVCIKELDEKSKEIRHWNTELCKDMYVSAGMECDENGVIDSHPDVVIQLSRKVDEFSDNVDEFSKDVDEFSKELDAAVDVTNKTEAALDEIIAMQDSLIGDYVDSSVNIENGEAEYTLRQKRHPDNPESKQNHAYQRGGIALGGNTQAGVTEEEYNASDKYKQLDIAGDTLTELAYEDTFGFNLAQGDTTKARGRNAASFNLRSEANGKNSTSFGDTSKANGENAIAGGLKTEANGKNSTTVGEGTIANSENCFVCGFYNEKTNTDSVFEVGAGGHSGWRHSAFIVDKNGVTKTRVIRPKNNASDSVGTPDHRYANMYTYGLDASETIVGNRVKSKQAPKDETEVVRLKELNEAEARVTAKIPIPRETWSVKDSGDEVRIDPNKYYVIEDDESRTGYMVVHLNGYSGGPTNTTTVDEYKFRFTCVAQVTDSEIHFWDDEDARITIKGLPETYEVGKTYEISIIDTFAVYTVWE